MNERTITVHIGELITPMSQSEWHAYFLRTRDLVETFAVQVLFAGLHSEPGRKQALFQFRIQESRLPLFVEEMKSIRILFGGALGLGQEQSLMDCRGLIRTVPEPESYVFFDGNPCREGWDTYYGGAGPL